MMNRWSVISLFVVVVDVQRTFTFAVCVKTLVQNVVLDQGEEHSIPLE